MRHLHFALPLAVALFAACSQTSPNAGDEVTLLDTGTGEADTDAAATDTGAPQEDTGTPVSDTGAPPTDTGSVVTDTGTPPRDTGVPPTDTGTPPTDTGTPPRDTGGPPADTDPPDTATDSDTGPCGATLACTEFRIDGPGSWVGTTSGEGSYDLSCTDTQPAPESVLQFTPEIGGTYLLDTAGSSFDTVIAVFDGTCDGPEVGCVDDPEGVSTYQASILIDIEACETAVIVIDGYGHESGDFTFTITGPF